MVKRILITGSTDGIGKRTAIKLAKEGHRVYLHGRNEKKLSAAIAEVKSASANTQVGGFIADYTDLENIQLMSKSVKKFVPNLDVLINNAGVFITEEEAEQGIDTRIVVNYLAAVLLTGELLSGLCLDRIINVSSVAQSTVSLDVLVGGSYLAPPVTVQSAYAQSKLAMIMWTFDLAKKLRDTDVIAVNPGALLDTKMTYNAYGRYLSSATKGADILFDLATNDKYKGVTGKYFDNDEGDFVRAHPQAYDQAKVAAVISTTEDAFIMYELDDNLEPWYLEMYGQGKNQLS